MIHYCFCGHGNSYTGVKPARCAKCGADFASAFKVEPRKRPDPSTTRYAETSYQETADDIGSFDADSVKIVGAPSTPTFSLKLDGNGNITGGKEALGGFEGRGAQPQTGGGPRDEDGKSIGFGQGEKDAFMAPMLEAAKRVQATVPAPRGRKRAK